MSSSACAPDRLARQAIGTGWARTARHRHRRPGRRSRPTGMVKLAPNFAWRDVALQGALAQELESLGVTGLRIQVQNDYDVAALSEVRVRFAAAARSLIYLGLGVGVGAGIIVRDRLFLGRRRRGLCRRSRHSICNSKGRYAPAGARAAPRRSSACAPSAPDHQPRRRLIPGHETIPAHLLDRNDEAAALAVRRAGHYLSVLIQNLWTYFQSGKNCRSAVRRANWAPPFLDAAQACLERYSGTVVCPCRKSSYRFGSRSVAVGAAAW